METKQKMATITFNKKQLKIEIECVNRKSFGNFIRLLRCFQNVTEKDGVMVVSSAPLRSDAPRPAVSHGGKGGASDNDAKGRED